MKKVKLSLVIATLSCLSINTFAADNLADMFKDGKIKGELKAYYFDRDTKTGDQVGILSTGVLLNYETASFKGFKIGTLFQSSASPFASADAKTEYKSDMMASGSQLSNAYLSYTLAKTTLKIGRQYIKSPLVRSSSSRLVAQAFEGETLTTKILPKTEILLMHVSKYQNRTDGESGIGQFEKIGDDGAYSAMIKFKGVPNTVLRAQYLDVKDDYEVNYYDGVYTGNLDSFDYQLAAQYVSSETQKGAESDVYAFKVGFEKGAFSSYVAYSKTDENVKPKLGLGSSVYGVYYTASTVAASAGVVNVKGAEAYALDMQYDFGNLKVGARYVTLEEPNGDKTTIPGAFVSYKFKGLLKGMSTHLAYEQHNYDSDTDDNEMRLKVVYKF